MNSGLTLVFYAIFAIILVWMYLAIRRGWGAPGFVAGAGVVGSIVSMLLLSGATLAVAWYFHIKEQRARQ
jgi:hypothetical protein